MELKIAILASGNGTNAAAIIEKSQQGILKAEVSIIICNNKDAGIISLAEKLKTPCTVIEHRNFSDRKSHDAEIIKCIRKAGCNAIVLAGYMRLLSCIIFREFDGPILNIHPALLPAFPGLHGIQDAWDYGVKLAGPTVHFVEEKMDSGPVIIQAATIARDNETLESLEKRIHRLEHRIYPQALQWLAEDRLKINGRKVELAPKNVELAQADDSEAFIWPPLEQGF